MLLALVALSGCANAIVGVGTFSGVASSSAPSTPPSSSSEFPSESTSSDTESSSSASQSLDDSDAVNADKGESVKYDNDVTIGIESVTKSSGGIILSNETGYRVDFKVANPSTETISSLSFPGIHGGCGEGYSMSLADAIDNDLPDPPASIAPGQTITFAKAVAVKKTSVGLPCLLVVKFSTGYSEAKFLITFPS
jgi:hypothetical protein